MYVANITTNILDIKLSVCYICGVRRKQKLTKNEYDNISYHGCRPLANARERSVRGTVWG